MAEVMLGDLGGLTHKRHVLSALLSLGSFTPEEARPFSQQPCEGALLEADPPSEEPQPWTIRLLHLPRDLEPETPVNCFQSPDSHKL